MIWLKCLVLVAGGTLITIPFGIWRVRCRRFGAQWFVAVHAAVPLLILVRLWIGLSWKYIPLAVAAAVAGHLIGGRLKARTRKM